MPPSRFKQRASALELEATEPSNLVVPVVGLNFRRNVGITRSTVVSRRPPNFSSDSSTDCAYKRILSRLKFMHSGNRCMRPLKASACNPRPSRYQVGGIRDDQNQLFSHSEVADEPVRNEVRFRASLRHQPDGTERVEYYSTETALLHIHDYLIHSD